MSLEIILLIILLVEVSILLVVRSGKSVSFGSSRPVFVDTSALMDGRLVVAARTGFIPRTLIIPSSVVTELQLLADQADHEKRSRARRGLEAVTELKELPNLSVSVLDDGKVGSGGVDDRLIELAMKRGGSICTIDFNLNKAARARDIDILNINELAGSIRMAFLPGETISLALTQKGQSATQAVGYLSDGTMVVVDRAADKIGKTVEIEFIRSLQTAAGRMMFAKLTGGSDKNAQNGTDKTEASDKPKGRSPRQKQDASNKTAPIARRNRKSSGEDSLIELVNNQ